MLQLQACLGIGVFILLAWAFSAQRTRVRWRMIGVAVALQVALAFLLTQVSWISQGLLLLNGVVNAIEAATRAGTEFLFGYLGGGATPYVVDAPQHGYVFAFRVLPQVVVFSVLVAVFWHWRLLPLLVRALGGLLQRLLGIGGAVSIAAGGSLFLGMTETPLVVRAYLQQMSRGELFMVMSCGMATVAGSVMVLYATTLAGVIDGALGHILTASVLNIIGALYIAHLFYPEPELTPTANRPSATLSYASTMDAISRGALDGLRLVASIGAMLLVFVALVALVNHVLGNLSVLGGDLSLQRIFGWLFAPIAWLMGVPANQVLDAGALLGSKVILNELIAFVQFAQLPAQTLDDRSDLIITYALCGFANLGSLGILIAGLTTLIPERRDMVLALAPWSLLSGNLANCITAAVIGIVAG